MFWGPVIGSNGLLVIEGAEGPFVGLDPSDGRVVRRPETDGDLDYGVGLPAILSDGRMIVSGVRASLGGLGGRRYVVATDAQGRTLWRTPVGDAKYGLIEPWDLTITDPTIGPDGTIYVIAEGALHAIEPQGGGVLWNRPSGPQLGSVVVSQAGTIYVAGFASAEAAAFSPDGRPLWNVDVGGIPGSMSVGADGTLYVANGAAIHAIASDGSRRWTVPLAADGDIAIGDIAIGGDGNLYVSSDGLYAISREGQILWHAEVGGGVGRLVVDGANNIYVNGGTKWLYAVGPDGSVKWRDESGSVTDSPPVMGADGTLYCVDGHGDTGGLSAIGTAGAR